MFGVALAIAASIVVAASSATFWPAFVLLLIAVAGAAFAAGDGHNR